MSPGISKTGLTDVSAVGSALLAWIVGGLTELVGVPIFAIIAVMKLLHVAPFADWSWWAVTAPTWGGLTAVVGLGIVTAVSALAVIFEHKN